MAARYLAIASLLLGSEAFMTSSSSGSNSIFMVPLYKQHVPVMVDGRQVAVKTAYYGDLFLGTPEQQNFTVVFDTGSGHLFIPSAHCNEEACLIHRRFDRSLSKTAVDLNHDGSTARGAQLKERDQVSIAYGTGEIIGDFVRDTVCIGMSMATARAAENDTLAPPLYDADGQPKKKKAPVNCARVRVISARQMSSEPFALFKFDGVLGLGLPALALHPEFHFFGQLSKRAQIQPIFSFFMSRSDAVRSEIAFGGVDTSRMLGGPGAVKYVPVDLPEQGYWRVRIHGVRVGNTSLSLCDNGNCTAIVDTGTSLLGVPSDSINDLVYMTARKLSDQHTTSDNFLENVVGDSAIDSATSPRTAIPQSEWPDCRRVPGPPLIFDMGDFEIVLEPDDYSRPVPMDVEGFEEDEPNKTHTICRASLLPVDMPPLGKNVFIWGEPILRKYYTSYDVKGQRVGFVTALHPPEDVPIDENANTNVQSEAAIEI